MSEKFVDRFRVRLQGGPGGPFYEIVDAITGMVLARNIVILYPQLDARVNREGQNEPREGYALGQP